MVNDIGIITLPEKAGHVALAVYVRGTERHDSVSEAVIAQISRAAYDSFCIARG